MVNSLKSKNVSLKIFSKGTITPASTVTDWNSGTADATFDGYLKSVKLDDPVVSRTTENYVGSDSNGIQYQEVYTDDVSTAKLTGSMIVLPDAEGNYVDFDSLHLTEVGSASLVSNYQFGGDGETEKQLVLTLNKTANKGVRFLMNNFKVNKFNTIDVPDKGIVTLEFEFECLASELYKQVMKTS